LIYFIPFNACFCKICRTCPNESVQAGLPDCVIPARTSLSGWQAGPFISSQN
jgi:hypothetical protein